MSLNNTIQNRRAIYPKEFTGEKVDDNVVQSILENAHWAPSHGNTTPWLFKVFSGPSLIDLVDQMKVFHEKNPDSTIREQKKIKVEKYKTLCSHIVAICVLPSTKHPPIEDTNAVACAVQNLWLSLDDYPDVGGYWSTGNGTYTQEMDAFLGLQNGAYCMGFFMIGHVLNKRTKSHRPPMDNHVQWM